MTVLFTAWRTNLTYNIIILLLLLLLYYLGTEKVVGGALVALGIVGLVTTNLFWRRKDKVRAAATAVNSIGCFLLSFVVVPNSEIDTGTKLGIASLFLITLGAGTYVLTGEARKIEEKTHSLISCLILMPGIGPLFGLALHQRYYREISGP